MATRDGILVMEIVSESELDQAYLEWTEASSELVKARCRESIALHKWKRLRNISEMAKLADKELDELADVDLSDASAWGHQ